VPSRGGEQGAKARNVPKLRQAWGIHAVALSRLTLYGRAANIDLDGCLDDSPAIPADGSESAGVTLVTGNLRGIARATVLSRATMRDIRQNLAFAFGYNALGIPVAAGALYPAFGLLLSPVFAGAAMALSSVSVVTNALRLNRVKL
jgi:hypothetical protein